MYGVCKARSKEHLPYWLKEFYKDYLSLHAIQNQVWDHIYWRDGFGIFTSYVWQTLHLHIICSFPVPPHKITFLPAKVGKKMLPVHHCILGQVVEDRMRDKQEERVVGLRIKNQLCAIWIPKMCFYETQTDNWCSKGNLDIYHKAIKVELRCTCL